MERRETDVTRGMMKLDAHRGRGGVRWERKGSESEAVKRGGQAIKGACEREGRGAPCEQVG